MAIRRAEVRFYFDADILGVAHVIAALRPDCTYPGDPGAVIHRRRRLPCPVMKKDDEDWVPRVAELGWLIITRDHNIRENPEERRAVRVSGARMVALSGQDAGNKWDQLRLLMQRWPQLEKLAGEPGPFIWLASRSRMTLLDLDP